MFSIFVISTVSYQPNKK
ncbi:TPA: erythromycin resistance leader peptide [Staphylococcus aureus]